MSMSYDDGGMGDWESPCEKCGFVWTYCRCSEKEAEQEIERLKVQRDAARDLLDEIRQILDRIEDIQTAQCVEMIDELVW